MIEIITKSYENLKEEKVNYITCWALPHTNLFNILTSIGFKPKLQDRYFCARILESKDQYLLDINAWNLSESDSEVY